MLEVMAAPLDAELQTASHAEHDLAGRRTHISGVMVTRASPMLSYRTLFVCSNIVVQFHRHFFYQPEHLP